MAFIHAKTAAGRKEIDDRGMRLAPALRSILLMIDGQRDDTEINGLLVGLRAPDDALQQLEALGLIEVIGGQAAPATSRPVTAGREHDPEVYRRVYDWMSESVRKHLGLKGYFLQLKIERCTDAAGLEQLWPDMVAALTKTRSPALANRWMEQTRALVEQGEAAHVAEAGAAGA